MSRALAISVLALAACSHSAAPDRTPSVPAPAPTPAPTPATPTPAPAAAKTLTIIGTNDLHGALERLPLIAGFIANVRAARAADGGGVVLVDGGDLFQGTLESNLGEGTDVVRAYNQIGYTASTVGNHEFDYGPVGPAVTAKNGEDPRGALQARIAEAKFPFLSSNLVDDATGKRPAWKNLDASTLVEVAGVRVGIIGAATESTPVTTMPANFKGLAIAPPAQVIASEAKALRERGAQVIIVTAHIGSECGDLAHPDDTSSCDRKAELFHLLDALPPGTVDVFVAGHTHAGVAHRIDGVATIESFSSGRAFGRVDLKIVDGKVAGATIHPPQLVCPLDADHNPIPVADCHPDAYEGRPVVADAAVQHIVDDALERAGAKRNEKLGVTVTGTITRAYGTESAEGDLLTELMLAARPDADVAMANGGGLRADIPAGDLTYGRLFAAVPFDNRFAIVEVSGEQLRLMIAKNLAKGGGILSWAGLTAKAKCKGDKLDVAVTLRGKPLDLHKKYKIATSDFLATGGDGLFGHEKPIAHPTDVIMRDALADVLRARKGGKIDPASYATKRLDFSGRRPVRCGGKASSEDADE